MAGTRVCRSAQRKRGAGLAPASGTAGSAGLGSITLYYRKPRPAATQLDYFTASEDSEFEYRVTIQTGNRVNRYTRPWSWNDSDLPGLVFDLERILPKSIAVYSFIEFDKEPGDKVYAFLPTERWNEIRRLLGKTFDCIFWKHPPRKLFKKVLN
jgi:hypothetical protein